MPQEKKPQWQRKIKDNKVFLHNLAHFLFYRPKAFILLGLSRDNKTLDTIFMFKNNFLIAVCVLLSVLFSVNVLLVMYNLIMSKNKRKNYKNVKLQIIIKSCYL